MLVEPKLAYYIYQITYNQVSHTGIMFAAAVRDYQMGVIACHEQTRPNKVADRFNLLRELQAQLSPVMLCYRQQTDLTAWLYQKTQTDMPLYSVTDLQNAQHKIWQISAGEDLQYLTEYFLHVSKLYIADGHHRSAAAAKLMQNSQDDQYFLAVCFAETECEILPYQRIVFDLAERSAENLLSYLQAKFFIEKSTAPFQPQQDDELGMYLQNNWYRLKAKNALDAAELSIPVRLLHQEIIEPYFDITDPRTDPRIDFVGGVDALAELQQKVNQHDAAVAFTVNATNIDSLFKIADAQGEMPPKSTWFTPKLIDGLVGFSF